MIRTLSSVLDRICFVCIGLFFVATCVATLLTTATMPHDNYTIAFVSPLIAIPLVLISNALLVLAFSSKRFRQILDGWDANKLFAGLVAFMLVAGLCWITLANVWPEWDAKDVEQMATFIEEGTKVAKDSYASRYPFQVPLALVIVVLHWVFGAASYHAFELLNILSVVCTCYAIRSLTRAVFAGDSLTEKMSVLLLFGFLPLVLYCTFQYANLLALPLCVEALALQVRYFKTKAVWTGILALVLACVAAQLKTSMLLVLIAMIVGWLLNALRERSAISIALIVGTISLNAALSFTTTAIGHATLGLEPAYALPKTMWIAMGTHPNFNENDYNYGWFNGYVREFEGDNYQPDIIRNDANRRIAESMSTFANNPLYAVRFFTIKYCTEWAQPDYESLLASSWMYASEGMPVMAERPMSVPLRSVYHGLANKALIGFLDIYQSLLVFGAAAYLFLHSRRDMDTLIPLLLGAGTALMYVFWEAQSQYIMHIYVLMIPYAAFGLLHVLRRTDA